MKNANQSIYIIFNLDLYIRSLSLKHSLHPTHKLKSISSNYGKVFIVENYGNSHPPLCHGGGSTIQAQASEVQR